jgi:hypothetical protein
MALLRELEEKRITGLLRFEGEGVRGEIVLYGGAIGLEQPARPDGQDPVDLLLGLGSGHYEVHQRLPPLAVSRGDDLTKHGSLSVHVPADLMAYCEQAGLTGVLELRNEGRRLEAIYDGGELIAIELDGRGDADLSEVFAWQQGRFRITLDPAAVGRVPEDAPVEPVSAEDKPAGLRKREDTGQFLRVVQMALVDVLDQSERARSPTRTSPPLPEPPDTRPRTSEAPPAPRRRPDTQTVRLVYLSGDAPTRLDDDTSTRHVQKGPHAELALTEAQPERRAGASTETSSLGSSEMATDERDSDRDEAETEDALPKAGAGAWTAAEAAPEAEPEAPAAAATAPAATAPAAAAAVPAATAVKKPASPLEAVVWAFVFVVIGLAILRVLAWLPSID